MKQNSKDWIQYMSAVAMIASGIILVFLSFVWTLEVKNGVLAYAGESFGAALALFGVVSYFRSQTEDFKTEIRNEIRRTRKEADDAEVHTGAPI